MTDDTVAPDCTQEKQALRDRVGALEARLAELEQQRDRDDHERRILDVRLHSLYRDSPIPIAFSRDGLNIGANPAYLKLFGYESEEEIVGTSLLTQIAASEHLDIASRIEARRRGEGPTEYETVGVRKDGS